MHVLPESSETGFRDPVESKALEGPKRFFGYKNYQPFAWRVLPSLDDADCPFSHGFAFFALPIRLATKAVKLPLLPADKNSQNRNLAFNGAS
jgi:hypothetical protein